MVAIIITGMPGAGKEGFVIRAGEHGFGVFRMGDVVREHAARNGISSSMIGQYANEERQKHGFDIWARRVLNEITARLGEDEDPRLVIDGCRGGQEIAVFRSFFGDNMVVVAVHASPKTRFERLKARARADAPMSRKEFDDRDERELSWGIGNVIALADVMIVNEGSLDEFYRNADEVLSRLETSSPI